MFINWKPWVILFALVVVGMCGGCSEEKTPLIESTPRQLPEYTGTIVAVGDSLTEGLGVDEPEAYPERLQRKLAAAGYTYRVVNAGISGETSTGTLSRIDWILTLKPGIVILETGANDGLRGIDPALTKKNIDEIVRRLKDNRVTVVLAGMQMVSNLGKDYTTAFAGMYPAVAEKHGVILFPFFLEGVAGEKTLNQPDGIHPTGAGYARVVDNLYPYVVEAITLGR